MRVLVLLLIVLSGFCVSEAGAFKVASVTICHDVDQGLNPIGATQTFAPDAPAIHAVVTFTGAKQGTKIKGSWISVDAIETKNYLIDSAEVMVQGKEDAAHFEISRPNKGWPTGNYRLDVYVGGKLVTSSPFAVTPAGKQRDVNSEKNPGMRQAAGKSNDQSASLVGAWQCQGRTGQSSLVFHSGNQLEFNGSPTSYALAPGVLRVQENGGIVNYPYALKGSTLFIQFADGSKIQCARASGQAQAGSGGVQAGGQEYLLQGKLCSYSSSGSGYSGSSYSSSRWAFFDGKGNFSYGSESSFSSSAGLYAGSDPGNRGRYRVAGNTIQLQFSDGSTDTATVTYRNGNRITELNYGGKHYAMAMCGT
jgi:hypothetical protein